MLKVLNAELNLIFDDSTTIPRKFKPLLNDTEIILNVQKYIEWIVMENQYK